METMTIQGIYRDRLISPRGEVQSDSGWKKNMIVLHCRILLAAFLRNEAGALGIRSLKIGIGDPAWDLVPPAAADPVATNALTDAAPFVIPVASLGLQYLTDADAPAGAPTNRIQITATLGPGQPNPAGSPPYPMREFGLFGEIAGAPFMIDYIRHPLIQKDAAVTLERHVRLIL